MGRGVRRRRGKAYAWGIGAVGSLVAGDAALVAHHRSARAQSLAVGIVAAQPGQFVLGVAQLAEGPIGAESDHVGLAQGLPHVLVSTPRTCTRHDTHTTHDTHDARTRHDTRTVE
jgi:hypothetical protein